MKKFGKFLFGSAALAAIGAGAYYAYKKFAENNGETEDEDEYIDDLDDFDLDDEEEVTKSPEYVSLNAAAEDVKEAAEDVKEAAKDALDNIADAAKAITE